MRGVKLIFVLLIIIASIFSLTYGYKPEVKIIQIPEDIRKLIVERNKVWFELRELLLQKPLDLNKIEEKAKELQKLEEDIETKTQTTILENLSKKLNLTKDQEESIRKILENYKEKLASLRKDLKQKALELREIRKSLIDEIKKVLTEEQKNKFEKYFKSLYINIPREKIKIWIKR